jgi:hypothetical protein
MNRNRTVKWVGFAAGGMALFILAAGCESTGGGRTIFVEPSSAVLTEQEAVPFTAMVDTNAPLVLPLAWRVSDPSLGSIIGTGGLSAVYESNGMVGNNVITVTDQGEAEGIVLVTQQ